MFSNIRIDLNFFLEITKINNHRLHTLQCSSRACLGYQVAASLAFTAALSDCCRYPIFRSQISHHLIKFLFRKQRQIFTVFRFHATLNIIQSLDLPAAADNTAYCLTKGHSNLQGFKLREMRHSLFHGLSDYRFRRGNNNIR